MFGVEIEKILDNPAWHALVGRQAHCAKGNERARFYDPEYTLLAGIAQNTRECFEALRDRLALKQVVVLATLSPEPENWSEGFEIIDTLFGTQMVCNQLAQERISHEEQLIELTPDDVPEMTALVELTRPGPFGKRTIEFGKFLGIRYGGKLIAMAGERMKPGEDFDEVSAVCTHPDYQGRGLAKILVHEISKQIFDRGHTPFLHVRLDNPAGIRSYSKVGFTHRQDIQFIVMRKI